MTWMCEVYCSAPSDTAREQRIAGVVARHGGLLGFREPPQLDGPQTVVLTYEFAELDHADAATKDLRASREHVEGPCQYG